MPCRSDHMEPRAAEEESHLVAQLIVYVEAQLGNHPATWILAAASSMYGDESRVSELTAILCEAISELTEEQLDEIVYNGRDRQSRILADWWDQHKEDDVRHEIEDARDARDAQLELNLEVRSLTGDRTGVIVEREWYERAKKILEAIDGV
jgi:hypothetical protein